VTKRAGLYPPTPLPPFCVSAEYKELKVLCFDTDPQVRILKGLREGMEGAVSARIPGVGGENTANVNTV